MLNGRFQLGGGGGEGVRGSVRELNVLGMLVSEQTKTISLWIRELDVLFCP